MSTTTSGISMPNADGVKADVNAYYTALKSSSDLKTSACTAQAPPPFFREALKKCPQSVIDTFYGCGFCLPEGIEKAKLTILDLGSGSGRDVYVAAQYTGGKVIGIDMTDSQLAIARAALPQFKSSNPSAAEIEFKKGFIENIAAAGISDGSVDIMMSNCVINLSPSKDRVLRGAFAALRQGGEMYFSDVYCDRRLPIAVREHKVLFGECLSGALYVNDFLLLCKQIGFRDPRVCSKAPIEVRDPELAAVLGSAQFFSITYRLMKIDALEETQEDYGQVAIYKGTCSTSPFSFALDVGHVFEKNRPVLVSGNTAAMLSGNSWLAPHFRIIGNRDEHFGEFLAAASFGGSAAPSRPVAAAAVEENS